MDDKNIKRYSFKVYYRPWYEWLAWAFWLCLEIFFLQNALASGQENEPRAALIFLLIFFTLTLGGVAAYISRRLNMIEKLSRNNVNEQDKLNIGK